ncbi:MAG: HDOD domain-containing protein [Rhodoferax sp.]|nr:HDOD domain-containing protein [Rhodoferax sp.]
MSQSFKNISSSPMTIARQPILDSKRQVMGFELFDRSVSADSFSAATDAALLFNLLSNADSEMRNTSKTIFINCTHQTLAGGHLELVEPERIVLEVPPVAPSDNQTEDIESYLQTLIDVHKRGFRLAFDESVMAPAYASWLTLASFVKADSSRVSELVTEKIETEDQFVAASKAGATLFQGYWFAHPVLVKGQTVRPAQAAIIQLINLIRKQASTGEIEEVFKHDPTLSFNLLRFINSAGFGLSCEVTSFRHAVMLLGLKKLFRWAALLMTTAGAAGSAPALGNAAVIRGRLMELLAGQLLTTEECDNAFVVGIFSLLDTMLGIPLADALTAISLPQSVTDALLHNTGSLAPFLQLTLACENADDRSFAELANALQLTGDQINLAHLQALVWADNLTQPA